jgi:phage tail protein X
MKNLRNESGQALVEMALVLPLLVLLLFGIVEMAIYGFTYITVQNAVGAGANKAVSGGTYAQVKAAIFQASPGLDASLLSLPHNIIVSPPDPLPTDVLPLPSGNVFIQVTYPVNFIFPVIPGLPNPSAKLWVEATLTAGGS